MKKATSTTGKNARTSRSTSSQCSKSKPKKELEPVGQFKVESSELVVSDPGYELGTWCAGSVSRPKPGTWKAFVLREELGDWGVRITELVICHESEDITKKKLWKEEPIDVGVDSGQAGFFDLEWFGDGKKVVESDYGPGERIGAEAGEFRDQDLFYAACCSQTLEGKHAGCLSHGVVCSSGIGDGSYVCYTHRNKDGQVVAALIDFSGHVLL